MSRWPIVVRNAIFGSRRVMTAFSPCVLAWLNTSASRTPASAAPSMTLRSVLAVSVATLTVRIVPPEIATTSVNVPPTSTPIIIGWGSP